MSALGRVLIAAGIGCVIAAIWVPEFILQFAVTGLIIFVAGAAILGSRGGPE